MTSQASKAYKQIQLFYGNTKAVRADVLYMDHIDQGIIILDALYNTTDTTKAAYCIHPIIQSTKDLVIELKTHTYLARLDPYVIMLAMEYRTTANMFLSYKKSVSTKEIENIINRLDKIPGLKEMLIADKVQNKINFETNYLTIVDNSDGLITYFNYWLYDLLGISPTKYEEYKNILNSKTLCKLQQ